MTRRPVRRFAAGASLVELMVAMVIALIGTIIIFQVFEVSEGIRRTTTSGGDAQQNGVLGLHVIEGDLRNAGMGFNDTGYAGCEVQGFDSTRPTGSKNFTLVLAPVRITGGTAAHLPDRLTAFYGSQNIVAGSTTLTVNMNTAIDPLRLMNRYGYRTGDLLIVLQPGTGNCSLKEVTALPAAQSDQVNHEAVTYALDWLPGGAQNVTARSNPAPGNHIYIGANTANATRVYNIGNLYDNNGEHSVSAQAMPVYNSYLVEPVGLTVRSGFSADAPTPVADNIVHLRALYGLDDGVNNDTVVSPSAADDKIVDRWVDEATFTAAGSPWNRLVAVRMAIVARSAQPEKPSSGKASDVCDATTAAPTWSGADGTGTATDWTTTTTNRATALRTELTLTADPANTEWRCYRYRVFETTVPLRNWIWAN